MINTLFGKNVAQIGWDGTPTTTTLQTYRNDKTKVLYIDSAGLEKHDNTDKLIQLTSIRPDLIWLLVNYNASIEEIELDISTKCFPNTPIIWIVSKVDFLQEQNISEMELRNFYDCIPDKLKYSQQLTSIRNKLIRHENTHQLVLMSLRQEEDYDRPIGLENLKDITNQYFSDQTSKYNVFCMPALRKIF